MLTSFICVSLGLTDFLADGIRVKKAEHKKLIYGLTFMPPLLITLFYPTVFISALRYAGICCLLLLMLLPPLMSWCGRYQQPTSQHKLAVWGGKPLLLLLLSCATLLTLYAIIQEIG
jgi:tyrosine-specific transport protein